jgi:DNA polymerase
MSRRELFLEEMGIAPLWRLREPAGGDGPRESGAGAVEAEVYQATVASPAAEPGLPEARAGAESVARKRAASTQPPEEGEARERRQRIMQMDWTALKGSVAQCVACPLHRTRTQTVFGVGDANADWLFVGEGPGAEEDAKGEPFVGQAGRLLDNMLAAIDLKRGQGVYIANVVKCRPPSNRNPEAREMDCCEPYLARQIELIQPKLIVALGRVSANHLLQTDASIASLRGRVHQYRGTPLVVTYHPAYLLRSLQEKAKAWVDLCFARETLDAIRKQPGTAPTRSNS